MCWFDRVIVLKRTKKMLNVALLILSCVDSDCIAVVNHFRKRISM